RNLRRREDQHSGTPPQAPQHRPTTRPAYACRDEYVRKGAWAYLAAWDVHQARVFGRCERKTGIAPFGRLVRQVMSREPYRSASNVFWVVDSGTSHRRPAEPHDVATIVIC
ncbi:MAG: hypothetical protein ACRD3M_12525, partial [Thermoanaerobaculia bacterium]